MKRWIVILLCLSVPRVQAGRGDLSNSFSVLEVSATSLLNAHSYQKSLAKIRVGLALLGVGVALSIPFSRGSARWIGLGGCVASLVGALQVGRVRNQILQDRPRQAGKYFDEFMYRLTDLAGRIERLAGELPAELQRACPYNEIEKPYTWLDKLVRTIQGQAVFQRNLFAFLKSAEGRAWHRHLQQVRDLLERLQDHFDDYVAPMKNVSDREIFDPRGWLNDVETFQQYSWELEELDLGNAVEPPSTAIQVGLHGSKWREAIFRDSD